MKKIIPLSLIFFSVYISLSAQTFEFDSINYKQIETGSIVLKNDAWLIQVNHSAFTEYFIPVNLPEKYRVNNQSIVFSGAIGRIPVDVKLAGTPIKLDLIRNLYLTSPRDGASEILPEDEKQINDPDSIGFIHNQTGRIIKTGDTYIIEQNINGEIKRYIPDNFPDAFKKENAEIYFSCVLRKIPENVRMMGSPVTIREIKFKE